MFIWRSLLQLPENHAAFCSLVDKGTHSAFVRLHENYPIKSRKLLRVLQRLVIVFLSSFSGIYARRRLIDTWTIAFCVTKSYSIIRCICGSILSFVCCIQNVFTMSFQSRILSALAHWSAVFGETEYLPLLVFPFVKLFQNNQLICFEVVASVLGTVIE